jgi:catechol 2,3-dioxygenase-like lactoylglutathione lyase family enzyme
MAHMSAIHHVILCVKELARARAAYGWLLPAMGFTERHDFGDFTGWSSAHGRVWIRPEDPQFAHDRFSKDRVGLCELAFGAPSRAAVDALAESIVAHGFTILHAPAEYPYSPGYYALFFADPDGIKLEYAHAPA